MINRLKNWINIFNIVLIAAGLVLGITGLGDFLGSNWNVIEIVFMNNPYLVNSIYVGIGIVSVIVAMIMLL